MPIKFVNLEIFQKKIFMFQQIFDNEENKRSNITHKIIDWEKKTKYMFCISVYIIHNCFHYQQSAVNPAEFVNQLWRAPRRLLYYLLRVIIIIVCSFIKWSVVDWMKRLAWKNVIYSGLILSWIGANTAEICIRNTAAWYSATKRTVDFV